MIEFAVDIDELNAQLLLKGDVEVIANNRRIAGNFRDAFSAYKVSSDEIHLRYEGEPGLAWDKLNRLAKKFEFKLSLSGSLRLLIADVLQEQQNFDEFSAKAELIRNNHCDRDELKSFISIIDSLLVRKLKPFQLLSAFHLAFSQNACNFSVPGAGKTSIVYAAFAYLNSLPPEDPRHVDKLLVIGPLNSFGPWEDEYLACFGQAVKSMRLIGGQSYDTRAKYLQSSGPRILTLMSYQGVPGLKALLKDFLQLNKVMVVLDEAHRVKNTDGAITAESVLELAEFAKSRVVLSGTPAPNGYEDLYNFFEFIWPRKKIIKFQASHLRDMSEKPVGTDNRVSSLIRSISPFYIRVTKRDLKLPPVTEHPPVFCEMNAVQRRIYDYIEQNYVDYFVSMGKYPAKSTPLTRARLIRLMQCATNPALLRKPLEQEEEGIPDDLFIDDSAIIESILQYNIIETPAKYTKLLELVERVLLQGEKVVIWSTFVSSLHAVSTFLEHSGIVSKLLFGGVPVERDKDEESDIETRESIIRAFHKSDSPFRVIIANPAAVSEAISLHQTCHTAIYLDRSFNCAHFIQSKDRIHRVGLKPNTATHYYYLLAAESIDLTIHERLILKEERMLSVIENEPIPLINLNLERLAEDGDDIKALVRDYAARDR